MALGTCWNLRGTYSLRGENTICSFWEPTRTCPEPTYLEGSLTPNDYFLCQNAPPAAVGGNTNIRVVLTYFSLRLPHLHPS